MKNIANPSNKTSFSWNHKTLDFTREDVEQPLFRRFEQVASTFPNHTVMQVRQQKTSYKALNQFANQVAGAILQHSSKEQEPVILLCDQYPQVIAAMLGVLKAGKIYVALDPSWPQSRLIHILNDTQSRVVLTNEQHYSLAEEIAPRHAVLSIDRLGKNASKNNPGLHVDPASAAAIYYTSGSTGEAKGVIVNHTAVMQRAWRYSVDSQITPADHIALLHSFSFGASRTDILGALFNGASLHPFKPKQEGLKRMVEWLIKNHITILHLSVTLFRELIDQLPERANFPDLRLVAIGGETIYQRDLQSFQKYFYPHCKLILRYSTTETHTISEVFIEKNTPLIWQLVPSGYPRQGKEVLILDDSRQVLGIDQPGEIAVRSAYLASGYWGDELQTAQKFLIDPQGSQQRIYLTGDMGMLDADGMLFHMGRKDFQVKIRGYRVDPGEVEAALYRLDSVREAVVVAEDDPDQKKRLVAYCVPQKGSQLTMEYLRQQLSRVLPDYMVPAGFVIMEALPKTSTGKIDRHSLPLLEAFTRKETGESYVAASDDLEARLVHAWEKVLGMKPIGVKDNFFELGGDSLTAMRLFVEIEKALGEHLPLSVLIDAPTVQTQAQLLRQKGWEANWSSLVALHREGNKLPLFLMAPGGGNVLTYRDLAARLAPDQPCYALQSLGIDGIQRPITNVPEIAVHYLKEIRRIQPVGPYYLGGSSFGGKVAYEIAQQLHDDGEAVAMVMMVDSRGVNYPKRMPGMTYRRKKFFKFLRNIQKHLTNMMLLPWHKRWYYLFDRQSKFWRRILHWGRERILSWRYPMPVALREVEAANRKAHYRPVPPRFDGRMILFRASQQPIGIYPDPTLGWGSLAGERLEVFEVPGNHTTLIYEPRVGILANKLNQILAEEQQKIDITNRADER